MFPDQSDDHVMVAWISGSRSMMLRANLDQFSKTETVLESARPEDCKTVPGS